VNGEYTRFALAWFVSILAACASTPIHYYTLTPPPGKALRAVQETPAIDVRVVHIPPQLDRAELMVRTGSTETALLENERWASPMKDEIKNAVRIELQRRLGETTGSASSFTKLAIDIDVQRFEAELGRYALFEATWRASLSDTGRPYGGSQVTTCAFRADEEIRGGYAAMVEGYQREITALADAIVSALVPGARGGARENCRP
jgi:uncharacterized lipoprotein YmbA